MFEIASGIGLACLAAGCYGLAANLQHRAVQGVQTGRALGWQQLRALPRQRRWLLGLLATLCGAALHVASLALAPLIVVQPIGVLAGAVTALLAVAAGRQRLDRATVLGVLACLLGIVGFVAAAAAHLRPAAVPDGLSAMAGPTGPMALAAGSAVLLFAAVGTRSTGWPRAPAYAAAAGVCFGVASALARVLTTTVRAGGSAGLLVGSLFGVATGMVIAVLLGEWFVQQAYASGRPDAVVACQTVVDPMVGALIGTWCFAETTRTGPVALGGELVAAGVAVLGVLALARRPLTGQWAGPG
ncbi:MAG TPA: DMT family transporter [Pseudonocardiaceae bacterium]|nr:DMT family transporter [Pseudonocardiaceae bacterium]